MPASQNYGILTVGKRVRQVHAAGQNQPAGLRSGTWKSLPQTGHPPIGAKWKLNNGQTPPFGREVTSSNGKLILDVEASIERPPWAYNRPYPQPLQPIRMKKVLPICEENHGGDPAV